MLDVFITSRVRRKIVVVYAKYPDFHTHVRGLAKLIKEDPGNIQRELKRLEKVGFLLGEKQGNTKIYSTNKQFPIFKELQSIVIKSQQQSSAGRPRRHRTTAVLKQLPRPPACGQSKVRRREIRRW